MATIEKRGETYRITVSIGYDVNGKQIHKRMTYKPPENLTPSQLKRDLQKKALDFEEKCQSGLYLDGSIKLADYIPMFYKDYCKNNVRESTLIGYKAKEKHIVERLGHLSLEKYSRIICLNFMSTSEPTRAGTICGTYAQFPISRTLQTQRALRRKAFAKKRE